MPPDLFQEFTQKTGISVRVLDYESQEDAVADIQAGKPGDVVVMDSRFIPSLVAKHFLARIDRSNVPNFQYVSAAFRDPSFDPGNLYSEPYHWGTTGIVYRRDLTGRDITHWADLWDPTFAGKVGLWKGQAREEIGLTLKMLGYSANTEKPEQLAAAMQKLARLHSRFIWLETIAPYTSVPGLANGPLVIAPGYAYDEIEGQKLNPNIRYVLPAEGAVLWSEHFIIPASTHDKADAERLINYLLTPSVMVKIVNRNQAAPANDGAIALLSPEIRSNPLIFPPEGVLADAEIIFPVSDRAEQLYLSAWDEFIAGGPGKTP